MAAVAAVTWRKSRLFIMILSPGKKGGAGEAPPSSRYQGMSVPYCRCLHGQSVTPVAQENLQVNVLISTIRIGLRADLFVTTTEATMELAEQTQAGSISSGVRFVTDALMLGGGVPVEAAGRIVGGVGVSGAPTGEMDDACARAGIDAIIEDIEF